MSDTNDEYAATRERYHAWCRSWTDLLACATSAPQPQGDGGAAELRKALASAAAMLEAASTVMHWTDSREAIREAAPQVREEANKARALLRATPPQAPAPVSMGDAGVLPPQDAAATPPEPAGRELRMPCTWTEDADGNWSTGCGNRFTIEWGTPNENGMRWCCYCGGKMEEKNG